MNHKNLLQFITIKQLNWRQIKWSELLKQYKFSICYTSEKENEWADALSKWSDHMQTKKTFDYSILKVNSNELLSFNQHELNMTLWVLRDSEKQYLIEKEKLCISDDKIKNCIKEHHDESLQSHSNVIKTLQLL